MLFSGLLHAFDSCAVRCRVEVMANGARGVDTLEKEAREDTIRKGTLGDWC